MKRQNPAEKQTVLFLLALGAILFLISTLAQADTIVIPGPVDHGLRPVEGQVVPNPVKPQKCLVIDGVTGECIA